jgi:hypothetical protein
VQLVDLLALWRKSNSFTKHAANSSLPQMSNNLGLSETLFTNFVQQGSVDKLIVTQVATKNVVFFGSRMFITVFTTARNYFLS